MIEKIKMHPGEYGEYLLEKGFTCIYGGDGEDFARYKKDNVEIWYYGTCIQGHISLDKVRNCLSCGQKEAYILREELFFHSTSTFTLFKTHVDTSLGMLKMEPYAK